MDIYESAELNNKHYVLGALERLRMNGIPFEVCMKIAKRIGQHWVDQKKPTN